MSNFLNANLAGTSSELNNVLGSLDASKLIATANLNTLASVAAAAFAGTSNELTSLIGKLQSIAIPTLPNLNLQAEITGLISLTPGSALFLSTFENIQDEFGSDLLTSGTDLLDLVSSATSLKGVDGLLEDGFYSLVPNFEKTAGSLIPAIRMPDAIKQAAVDCVGESTSIVNQNPLTVDAYAFLQEHVTNYVSGGSALVKLTDLADSTVDYNTKIISFPSSSPSLNTVNTVIMPYSYSSDAKSEVNPEYNVAPLGIGFVSRLSSNCGGDLNYTFPDWDADRSPVSRTKTPTEGYTATGDIPAAAMAYENTTTPRTAASLLTQKEIYNQLIDEGFTPEDARLFSAIAMAESSGNANALNPKSPDLSYGLFQINMIGKSGPERRNQFGLTSNEELYDSTTNIRAAKAIYNQQGIRAWGSYTNGSYKKFMAPTTTFT